MQAFFLGYDKVRFPPDKAENRQQELTSEIFCKGVDLFNQFKSTNVRLATDQLL